MPTSSLPSASRRRMLHPLLSLVALAVCAVAALLISAPLQQSARAAGTLPAGWPGTLQIGLMDGPGDAAALAASAPFGFRYQYLSGGVNTGSGWATWNAGGSFVSAYIQESVVAGITPVFSYYQLRSSTPGAGMSEATGDLANFASVSTMAAYYQDLTLFFQKAAAFPTTRVLLQVEPDAWGFIEQASTSNSGADVPVQVAATGDADLAGLPNTAAGFAQAVTRLRDKYAPNVLLGYHLSVWGTKDDILYSKPADSVVIADAQTAAAFYQSLGARFDLTFAEASDRDAAFKQYVYGDGGASWWSAADYARNVLFLQTFHSVVPNGIVDWQIPLGNTRMLAENNSWGHYQDNHVEWLLADPTRAHLQAYANAGVVAFLFGGGAAGTTCACDALHDGVTNPPAIDGNTASSLGADDDGGFFRQQVTQYYQGGALPLPAGSSVGPTPSPGPTTSASPTPSPTAAPTQPASPTPSSAYTTVAAVGAGSVTQGGSEPITATVTSRAATTALIDVEVDDATGHKVFQSFWDQQALAAGVARSYSTNWAVPAAQATGTYTVAIGIFAPAWTQLLSWTNSATGFTVQALAPTPAAAYASSARVSAATVSQGGSETMTATVTSAATATLLVDVEVHDASGAKVFQQYWDQQSFAAGAARTFTATWSVPAAQATGTYTVTIGIFAPAWAALDNWNNSAASITVTN